MGGIFVSYRRQDSAGHARALYDRVRPRFPGLVFMDVAGSIPPGVDFVDAIEKAVGTCRILIVIIGREWVPGTDQKGRRRLDDPNDFIRLEVATALRRNVVVIPVLVEGAQMPTAGELPEDLALLARRQAVELRDTRWDADVDELIVALARTLAKDPAADAPRGATAATGGERPDVPRASRPEPIVPAEPRRPSERPRTLPPQRPPREPPLQRVQSKRAWLAALGVLVAVAASVGAYSWLVNARVTVPRVVGQSVDSASQRLRSAGLVLGDTTARRTTTAPSGHVVQQSPEAGTRVQKGSAVSLVISERPPRVVPNVVAQDLEAARVELSRAGISVRSVRNEETQQAKPNTVLRVAPAAGTEIASEATAVDLVVAVASDRRPTVPDLMGLNLGDATEQLTRAGLVARSRAGQRNSSLPELQVIAHEPVAETKLERGATVTLFFNPKALLATPNVVGRSLKEARDVLQEAGFVLIRVDSRKTDRAATGTVLAQRPPAETPVAKERAQIELTVAERIASLSQTKIAFASAREGEFQIYLMDADGTNQTRLTRSPERDSEPSWSPDGTKIVFQSWLDGINVMNADGTQRTPLQLGSEPSWSPDGTQIAFAGYLLRGGRERDIYVMGADGRNPRSLTNARDNHSPAWSPDGKRIAFVRERSRTSDDGGLFVVDVDSASLRRLSAQGDFSPAWSPDGTQIAFTAWTGSGVVGPDGRQDADHDIYVMNADGTNRRNLTRARSQNIGASWSPDGKKIVFASLRDGAWAIYVMGADGTEQTRLTEVASGYSNDSPSWSPFRYSSNR